MNRYKLVITFETKNPLTDEQKASAQNLVSEYESDGTMPAGRVVDVSVIEEEELRW